MWCRYVLISYLYCQTAWNVAITVQVITTIPDIPKAGIKNKTEIVIFKITLFHYFLQIYVLALF